MENYFHGHSSGLDPLVSFYNQAVLMQGEKIEFLSIDTEKLFTTQSIQLINSHIPRNTQPLVAVFKKQIETSAFRNSFEAHIPKWNLNLINALIENRETELMEAWKQLSFLSMEFFSEMIPETFMEFWKQGINNEAYYCKLCGAGGGGLFLVKILDEDYFKESLIKYGFNRFIPCSSDN
jgi:mevalonate kinase